MDRDKKGSTMVFKALYCGYFGIIKRVSRNLTSTEAIASVSSQNKFIP